MCMSVNRIPMKIMEDAVGWKLKRNVIDQGCDSEVWTWKGKR